MKLSYLDQIKNPDAALRLALDIRKFEIELYWKRAAYFWTFIAATLVGYVALQSTDKGFQQDFSVILSCFGIVLSWAWVLANKGSKFWQENWEGHVDILESDIIGPMYKTVISNSGNKLSFSKLLVGSARYSVSKINQLISIYVLVLWIGLLWYALRDFNFRAEIDWLHVVAISLSGVFCGLMAFLGCTNKNDPDYKITTREPTFTQDSDPVDHE